MFASHSQRGQKPSVRGDYNPSFPEFNQTSVTFQRPSEVQTFGQDNVRLSNDQFLESLGLPLEYRHNQGVSSPGHSMGSANYGQLDPRREILTLTIEIGEGQNDDILIFEGDDPNYLAAEFAAKHGIGE